jgi:ureidoacrylate peracid hydrolase
VSAERPTRASERGLQPALGLGEWPTSVERVLHPAHTAIVVLDMVNKFLPPESASRKSGVVETVAGLLEVARSTDVVRIFVRVRAVDPEKDDTGGYRMRLAGIGATDEARARRAKLGPFGDEFVTEVSPRPGEIVIEKVRFSAFFGTWLENLLHNRGIRTVVLTGVASFGAVIATAFDAAWRDFYVVIPAGGVAGENKSLHDAAMTLLSEQSIVPADRIASIWRAGA